MTYTSNDSNFQKNVNNERNEIMLFEKRNVIQLKAIILVLDLVNSVEQVMKNPKTKCFICFFICAEKKEHNNQ